MVTPDKPEQTTSEYDEWVASRAAEREANKEANQARKEGETQETGPDETEEDRIQRAVEKALAKERERVGAAAPQSSVPNHGGGIGVDNHEGTWSLYDQELASAGEHPLQNQ
jgi:hypothetical protein